ncbi:MAG: ABC transporter substrate-binding protein [Chloroflexaceae bacterium]|nr:ABC transporter substrate-binding protein [Chloroflexaceae bacterium]
MSRPLSSTLTRRRFLRALAASGGVALLAACGAQPAAQPTTAPASAPQPPAAPPAAPTQSAPTERSVRDSKGNAVTLQSPATRVVALGEECLDFFVVLGVQPIGYGSDRVDGVPIGASYTQANFLPNDRIGNPTFVGAAATPSLETISRLKPDLIVTYSEEALTELRQIAPTFQIDVNAAGYWRTTLQDLALLVNRPAEAEAFTADYETAIKTLAEQLAPVAKQTPKVLLVYSFAASDGTMLLGNDWNGSKPFTQLGFTVLEPADVTFQNGIAPISPESAAQLETDILVVLRPLRPDGTRPEYPLDTVLASRKDVRVVYQVFGSTRASTAPYTDKFVLEEVAALLGATQPATSAFPLTIAHTFGSTTLDAAPERIVTVGLTEQDALLALGVTPVGTTEWFGGHPGALWPWATPKLTGDMPTVVGDSQGMNYETIAALKPDLILARYAGLTQEQYDTLSKIAPVVAQPAEHANYGVPWQELTQTVGQIVGKPDEAARLVADVEGRFAAARAAHPEFDGARAVVVMPYQTLWVYGRDDARSRLLTNLGFVLPDELDAIVGKKFAVELSMFLTALNAQTSWISQLHGLTTARLSSFWAESAEESVMLGMYVERNIDSTHDVIAVHRATDLLTQL